MEQLWRAFNHVIPLFITLIPIVTIVVTVLYIRWVKAGNKRKEAFFKAIIYMLFILSVIGVLLVTLLPIGATGRTLQLIPFASSIDVLFNSVHFTVPVRVLGFNIILFIPFGLFLALILKTKSVIFKTTIVGMMFSISIETLQFILNSGRVSNVDDVILNTLGTFLGAAIGIFITNMAKYSNLDNRLQFRKFINPKTY